MTDTINITCLHCATLITAICLISYQIENSITVIGSFTYFISGAHTFVKVISGRLHFDLRHLTCKVGTPRTPDTVIGLQGLLSF
jgi:hypothetical protein